MEIILLKMGEMVLKGLNRSRFESSLLSRLRAVLAPYGAFGVSSRQSAVYAVPEGECDMDGAFAAAGRVFGFTALCRALQCGKDMEEIQQKALSLPGLNSARSFKVEARRADKRFSFTSPQICEQVGGFLHETLRLPVDVHTPGEVVWVEIRESAAYVHTRPAEGAGGLPPGTAGKAVLLLSGGIDSPVAGWRMARRGLSLLPVHFHSYPYTSPEAKDKVLQLARILGSWCGPLTVRLVSFTAIQEAIRKHCPGDLVTVLTRRSMCRVANEIALRNGAGALVTGDCLGQVASQTMEALAVTAQASALPLLRPLIGMDKEEVARTARRVGTFETSILPYEDCCGLFTPRHPQTKPKLEAVLAAEKLYDYETLEAETLKNIEKNDV
ncbi:MAG: tRNA 4-thiouridine(8) synthase ThiI [Oscillospiraceae bacterium]|jgi:thiamine biosynthesis protein ThiI|nr:tRNA 4-thiouridine(8) synthase ThiI [Oscillospiraceae bacterium]